MRGSAVAQLEGGAKGTIAPMCFEKGLIGLFSNLNLVLHFKGELGQQNENLHPLIRISNYATVCGMAACRVPLKCQLVFHTQ